MDVAPGDHGGGVPGQGDGRQQGDALADAALDGVGGLPAKLLQPGGDGDDPVGVEKADAHGDVQLLVEDAADIVASLPLLPVLKLQQSDGAGGQGLVAHLTVHLLGDPLQQAEDLVVDEPRDGGSLLGQGLCVVIAGALAAHLHGELAGKLHPRGPLQAQLTGPVGQLLDAHPVRHGEEKVVAAHGQGPAQIQIGVLSRGGGPAGRGVGRDLGGGIVHEVVVGRAVGDCGGGGDGPLHEAGKARGHLERGAGGRADGDGSIQGGLVGVVPKEHLQLLGVHPVGEHVGIVGGVGGHGQHLPRLRPQDHDGPGGSGGDGAWIFPKLRVLLPVLIQLLFLSEPGFLDVVDQGLFHHLLELDVQGGLDREPALGHGLAQHVHDGAGPGLFDGGGPLPGDEVTGEIGFTALFQARHPDEI